MKLTNEIRDQIESAFYKANIEPKSNEIKNRAADLAIKLIGAAWRDAWPAYLNIDAPSGVFCSANSFEIKYGDGYGNKITGKLPKRLNVPEKFVKFSSFVVDVKEDKVFSSYQKDVRLIIKEFADFNEKAKKIRSDFEKMLKSAATYKKLKEIYPEIDKYYNFKEPVNPVMIVNWSQNIKKQLESL